MSKQVQQVGRQIERSIVDRPLLKPVKNILEAPKKEAERAQAVQSELVGRQQQKESLRLAEVESEIGKKRLLATRGGRRSLIASR